MILEDFLEKSSGTSIGRSLIIVEDSWVGEKEYLGEPVHVSYLKATNGKEKFVIKETPGTGSKIP